jgi:quinol monooxygenase YgiN
MLLLASLTRLRAKAGKEKEVQELLQESVALVNEDVSTLLWLALRSGSRTFTIVAAFADQAAREQHVNGPVAEVVLQREPDLFESTPQIERVTVLGAKVPHERRLWTVFD